MALFKNGQQLTQTNDVAFDAIHTPGEKVPHSGLYRCDACGDEIAANANTPFPPQNHHQHAPGKGAIRWKLLVYPVSQR